MENILLFQIATVIYSIYSTNAVSYYTLFAVDSVKLLTVGMLGSGVLSALLISLGSHTFGVVGAVCGNIGYLGTLILPIFAVNKLEIHFRELIRWVTIPFFWFLVVSSMNIILVSKGMSSLDMISISCIQSIVIFTWLILQHKAIVSNALNRAKNYKDF